MKIFSSLLLKKSLNQKSKLVQSMQVWLSDIAFHFLPFGCKLWLQSFRKLNQYHVRDCFQAFVHRKLKWLCCSIGIWETSFSQAGRRFRSAALHRIWFGTCWSVPVPYFHLETNKSLEDWAKQWLLLWSVTSSREIHWTFVSHEIINLAPKIYKAFKPFWHLKWVSISRVATSSYSQPVVTCSALSTKLKLPVLVLACGIVSVICRNQHTGWLCHICKFVCNGLSVSSK